MRRIDVLPHIAMWCVIAAIIIAVVIMAVVSFGRAA